MDVNNVVVGYDGSDNAQTAIDAALSMLNDGGVVHLVMAYDAPSIREIDKTYAAVPEEFKSSIDLLSEPRSKLEAGTKYIADRGHSVVEHLLDDDPADAILKTAKAVQADLIVVGSRGLGRASQVLRGSVSTKIAHHSPVDFLVVH